MQASLVLLSLLVTSCLGALTKETVIQRLDVIDAKFKREGPSLDMLQDYDSILKDLWSISEGVDNNWLKRIGNVQLKHGLINYSLDRERLAWSDYKACSHIEKNGFEVFHKQCFSKFVDLSMSLGKIEELKEVWGALGGEIGDQSEVNGKIKWLEGNNTKLNQLMAKGQWEDALDVCNEILKVSYGDPNILKKKVEILNNSVDSQLEENVRSLVEVYSKLIKYSPNELHPYAEAAKLKMFGQSGRKGEAGKLLMECLRIDNEFGECRTVSRVNIKLSQAMDLIRDVSDYYSSVYAEGDVEWIKDKELSSDSWEKLYEVLFYPIKRVKIKNGLDRTAFASMGVEDVESLKTNFDVIIELYTGVFTKLGFSEEKIIASDFMSNMFKIAREAYYQNGEIRRFKKDGIVTNNRFYKKVRQNCKGEKDVVDYAIEIDKLLARNDFAKLKQVIGSISESLKTTRLLRERVLKFEEIQQAENQRRQQQQQQQQRERYQQYQHHQHQQHQQPRSKPANDYYKILGVDPKANQAEIKKAYREKMRQNHPDKIKGSELTDEEIENKVAEINNAYEVLSDQEQRDRYDRHGEDPNDTSRPRGPAGGHQGFQGNPFGGFGGSNGFNFGGFNFGGQKFHFRQG